MIHLIRMCAPNETVKYDQSITQLGFESGASIGPQSNLRKCPRPAMPTAGTRPVAELSSPLQPCRSLRPGSLKATDSENQNI